MYQQLRAADELKKASFSEFTFLLKAMHRTRTQNHVLIEFIHAQSALLVNNVFIFQPRRTVEVYTRSLTLARLCATALVVNYLCCAVAMWWCRCYCVYCCTAAFTASGAARVGSLRSRRPLVQLNAFHEFHPIWDALLSWAYACTRRWRGPVWYAIDRNSIHLCLRYTPMATI